MLAYLERDESELAEQCAATIRYEQRPDGGWSTTPDGATDLSASVQAYFALKLMGHDPTDHAMRQARERIRYLGGADAADAGTRYWLALFGQVSYDVCQSMPPEAFLFGRQKSLLRTTTAILWSHRPVYSIGIGRGVRELFVQQPVKRPAGRALRYRFSNLAERRSWTPLRRCALNRIQQQLLKRVEHLEAADPTCQELIYRIVALRTLGHDVDSAEISHCEEALHGLVEIDETTGCVYPRFSANAVADSALVLQSLVESGVSPLHPAVQQVREFVGDTAATKASLSEEDLAKVITALRVRELPDPVDESALPPHFDVCCHSVDSEFSKDLRSGAADALVQSQIDRLTARLKSSQGSSQPHLAGGELESLAATGDADAQTAIDSRSRALSAAQRADGSWSDSDGMNQILSASAAIRGLLAAGSSAGDDCVAAAANWLTVEQRPNGSWNNSPAETAWAILGLVAAGHANRPSIRRGINYLLDEQDDVGGWADARPVFRDPACNQWFRNDLHSTAWSLMALSRFAAAASSAQSTNSQMSLRLVAASADV
jgi:squalene-hopene/tetraprenyl-beta-curcumene cyclase